MFTSVNGTGFITNLIYNSCYTLFMCGTIGGKRRCVV